MPAFEIVCDGDVVLRLNDHGLIEENNLALWGIEDARVANNVPVRIAEAAGGGMSLDMLPKDLDVLYCDEVQFMDYGESRTAGAWIKLRLPDPELLAPFRGLDPKALAEELRVAQHVLKAVVYRGDIVHDEGEPEPEPVYKRESMLLWQSNVFSALEWCKAVGSDEDFRAWVQRQPSVISGQFSEYVHGDGRCVAAHVTRAHGKPLREGPHPNKIGYCCVPMTDDEHQAQHREGWEALLGRIQPAPKEPALDWFEARAVQYRRSWAWETLKAQLGYDSWNQVPPEALCLWAIDHGLLHMLPPCYRDAAP